MLNQIQITITDVTAALKRLEIGYTWQRRSQACVSVATR